VTTRRYVPMLRIETADRREGSLIQAEVSGRAAYYRVRAIAPDGLVATLSRLARRPRNHRGRVAQIDPSELFEREGDARAHAIRPSRARPRPRVIEENMAATRNFLRRSFGAS